MVRDAGERPRYYAADGIYHALVTFPRLHCSGQDEMLQTQPRQSVFGARIRVRGKYAGSVVPDQVQLLTFPPSFKPTAVGFSREYGWVTLQTENGLDRFISERYEKRRKELERLLYATAQPVFYISCFKLPRPQQPWYPGLLRRNLQKASTGGPKTSSLAHIILRIIIGTHNLATDSPF